MWIGHYKFDFYSYSYLMVKSKRDLVDLIKVHEHNLKGIAEENIWLHKALDKAMDTICSKCKDREFGVENCTECIYLKHDDVVVAKNATAGGVKDDK